MNGFFVVVVFGELVIDNVISDIYILVLIWKLLIEKNGIFIVFWLCWWYVEEWNYSCENLSVVESWYEIKNLSKWDLFFSICIVFRIVYCNIGEIKWFMD